MIGTANSGIYAYQEGRFSPPAETGSLPRTIFAIHQDAGGRLWFGTRGGLVRWDGRTWQLFTTREGRPDDEVRAIADDPDSLDVWRVPRRNYFMGRWIRHSGWYPNFRQPQLFRHPHAQFEQGQLRVGEEHVVKNHETVGPLRCRPDLAKLVPARAADGGI